MSARSAVVQTLAKAGMVLGGVLLLTMLLSAMPGHRPPLVEANEQAEVQTVAEQQEQLQDASATSGMDQSMLPGMDMDEAKVNEASAVSEMSGGHQDAHSQHMHMTAMRPQSAADVQRANEIVAQLRQGIEKYRDYHVALNDGYKIFLPNLPQPEYHFSNYWKGFLESFNFDPARPTSLLYKKTATGYELVGAMYTMPKRATVDQLNERVPLSVAMWHLHTNLCMPARSALHSADWSKFGLKGSIASKDACDDAGGRFKPVIFAWMVHVYPYEDSLDKIFAMHHHMD